MEQLTQNLMFTIKGRILNAEHSFHKYHSFTNYDFIFTAISFLLKPLRVWQCNLFLHRTLYHVLSWYHVSSRTWCHTSESIFLNGHFNSPSAGDIFWWPVHCEGIRREFSFVGVRNCFIWAQTHWEHSLKSPSPSSFICEMVWKNILVLRKTSKTFLAQKSANILCKGPDSKYDSSLPAWKHHRMALKWMNEAVFQ